MRITGALLISLIGGALSAQTNAGLVWKHISTKTGELAPPNTGTEQTSPRYLTSTKTE